jgi:hypothetical protein
VASLLGVQVHAFSTDAPVRDALSSLWQYSMGTVLCEQAAGWLPKHTGQFQSMVGSF